MIHIYHNWVIIRTQVLAHRGEDWTLLQNVAKQLWDAVRLALTASSCGVDPSGGGGQGAPLLDLGTARCLVVGAVRTAADCLLDMLQKVPCPPEERPGGEGGLKGPGGAPGKGSTKVGVVLFWLFFVLIM